jgi:hypothetical protein
MSNNGGKKIGIDRAKKMIANYKSKAGANATQSVWFSAETLAAALGLTVPADHPISGLRFHFAAYDPSMNDAGEAAKNQQTTLVFEPTTQEGTSQVSKALTADPGTADEGEVYNDGTLCPPYC